MQKIILYPLILIVSGGLGYFVSNAMRHSDQPPVATATSLQDSAVAMADAAVAVTSDAPPEFTMPNLEGGNSSFSDWAGKPRLVNFWATWCAPCRREIPLLKALQDDQGVPGLQVIGIAHDDLAAVAEYADEAQFNYPILVGELESIAAAESFDLELMALPFTLVVSSSGDLVNAHIGEVDEDEAQTIISVLSKLESRTITLADARAQLAQ
ncbi:MAG: TlpA disulfide reductase family protein [Pseudomonadota bacterium]